MKIEKALKTKADRVISTRLKNDDFTLLDKIARKAGVNPSWLARRILERAIAEGIEIDG